MPHEADDMPNQRHARLQKWRLLLGEVYGGDLPYEVEDYHQRREAYIRSGGGHSH